MEQYPQDGKSGDIEAGTRQLYPILTECPELRWAFIRKLYAILAIQLLSTVAVIVICGFVHPVHRFFVPSYVGFGLLMLFLILPLILLWPLYHFYRSYPINYVLLGTFTVPISFSLGLTCVFMSGNRDDCNPYQGMYSSLEEVQFLGQARNKVALSGKVILETAILALVAVVSLTVYIFWAARRGHDFNFACPFLFAALNVLLVFALIQFLSPLGKFSSMIYGGVAALVYGAYIVRMTDRLIKHCTYDQYIWAAAAHHVFAVSLLMFSGGAANLNLIFSANIT